MNRSGGGTQGKAGFTLVEVLATLVLVAIILPVAMEGISLALAATDHARRQTEACALAESKLAELVATGDWQGANLVGEAEDAWPGYRWTAEVDDWEDATMRLLTVRVHWAARGHERELAMSTLVDGGGE